MNVNQLPNVTYDPINYRYSEIISILGEDQLSVAKLADNPVAIQLLIRQNMHILVDLGAAKAESTGLNATLEGLRVERESLLLQTTQLRERDNVSLLEIPISLMGGFAINMLTDSPNNGVGWALLMLSVVCLLLIRSKQIAQLMQGLAGKWRK
jgi:hypothetical protein